MALLIPYSISFLISTFMILYSLKFTERSHMRERSRLLGKYIRENIPEKIRLLIDKIISPYFLRQFLVLADMICGFMEGVEGKEQLIILITMKDENIQTDEISKISNENKIVKVDDNKVSNEIYDEIDHEIDDGIDGEIDDKIDGKIKDEIEIDGEIDGGIDGGIEGELENKEDEIKDEKKNNNVKLLKEGTEYSNDSKSSIDSKSMDSKSFPDSKFTDSKSIIDSGRSITDKSITDNIPIDGEQIPQNNYRYNDITSISNTSNASKISNEQRNPPTDDIVPIGNSTTINNLPINIKSDDQEFIKQSLILNNIKKKIIEVSKNKIEDTSIDLSDDSSNDNTSGEYPMSTEDRTNRFIETTEPIKKKVKITNKTKTSIERKGNKLQISIKRD